MTGNLTEALSFTLEALQLYRETGDCFGELHTLMDIAPLRLTMGEGEKALTSYKQALEMAKRMGGHMLKEGHALRGMGIIYQQQGKTDQAQACLAASRDRLSEAGDFGSLADVCQRLGDLLAGEYQQYAEATSCYRASLEYYRKKGNPQSVRSLLSRLGHARWANGKPKEALVFYLEALNLARQEGNVATQGESLAALGVVYREVGHLKKSLECGLEALRLAQCFKDFKAEGYFLSSLSDTYLAMGQTAKAEDTARAAASIRRDAWALYRMGRVLLAQGKRQEGQAYFMQAMSSARKSDDRELMQQITTLGKERSLCQNLSSQERLAP